MRKINPLLSIIIPVYNGDKYIEACMRSIVNQTYRNLEIIIIDDGSKDSSYEICRKFMRMDNRIKLISQKNMGVSSARNHGLELCTGEYITFVDSDDTVELDMYEILMKEFNENDIDIAICSYSKVIKNESGSYNKMEINQEFDGVCSKKEALVLIQSNNGYKGFACNKVFKRKVLIGSNNELIRFNSNLRFMEDNIFVTSVILNCEKVRFINRSFYNYFIRENSATAKRKIEEKIKALQMLLDIVDAKYIEAINIIKWNIYTEYIYEMAYKYIYEKNNVYNNINEIVKLRKKFTKGNAISKKGLLRKIIIEYGIRFKINRNIIKKIISLNNN